MIHERTQSKQRRLKRASKLKIQKLETTKEIRGTRKR